MAIADVAERARPTARAWTNDAVGRRGGRGGRGPFRARAADGQVNNSPFASPRRLSIGLTNLASAIHIPEIWLRRAIPALIVALLSGVLAIHVMLQWSDRLDREALAGERLADAATVATTRLALHPDLDGALADPATAQDLFAEAFPAQALRPGTSLFLVGELGRVIATHRGPEATIGIGLPRLLGGALDLIAQGAEAGPRPVLLDATVPAVAVLHAVPRAAGEKPVAVVLARTQAAILAPWQTRLVLEITLFLATAAVLLVFLYAYLAQTTRLQETDRVFAETTARFDAALARGHSGLWDWDLARGTLVWSESMYEILGLQPQDRRLSFGEVRDLVHPDEPDLLILADSVLRTEQSQIDHRIHMRHADGHYVCVRLRAELVRYKGTTPHLIGIAVDISELEAQRQRQRDADIRLRDAIENISEAFVLWDSRRRLVMCNTKYQQLYRLPSSATKVGASFDSVMAVAKAPTVHAGARSEARDGDGSSSFEAQLRDGRWLQISERRTQDGGFVSVGTDVTTIKTHENRLRLSEQELLDKNDSLRESHRQLELQAQQLVELAEGLREEKERAKEGNRAKSEFLANISHELRTPLNAILGFSEVMQQRLFGPLGAEQYDEYVGDIRDSGTFLLNVINDILDMSKIEAGRMELSPERVDIHEVLDDALRLVSGQAEAGELTLVQKVPEGLVIEADRRALKQIMLNLLSNAVKFTNKGGRVEVTAKALPRSVVIMIHDNGIGIAPHARGRLGRPFEQVQSQFTKDHHGSGLGLAIARSLAQLHGGSLKLRSREGAGTLVAVRLPFHPVEVEAPDADGEALTLPDARQLEAAE